MFCSTLYMMVSGITRTCDYSVGKVDLALFTRPVLLVEFAVPVSLVASHGEDDVSRADVTWKKRGHSL